MRHSRLVAHRLNVVDDVVGVLLERVVHARLKVRLRAVVVDAESAADVEVLEASAKLRHLRVATSRFVQRAFDDADVRDLATEMEMEQLEAVLHASRLELLESADDFADRQAELRAEPARGLPAPAPARRELHPHANLRPDSELLGGIEDEDQLGVLLDDRNDIAS